MIVVVGLLCRVPAAPAVQPAYSFRNPFTPAQCGNAIKAGQQALARNTADPRGRLLLAEGLLCRGLDDDAAALDAAIALLRRVVTSEPASFFASLDFADALRKRFPLSEEAELALRQAQRMLELTDVGAGRRDLADYIAENLAAIGEQRTRAEPLLAQLEAGYSAGALSPQEMRDDLALLMMTGPVGLARAMERLEAYLADHPDAMLATLYRAELRRGQVSTTALRALYSEAEATVCGGGGGTAAPSECALVRWRLNQIEMNGSGYGGPAAAIPPPN